MTPSCLAVITSGLAFFAAPLSAATLVAYDTTNDAIIAPSFVQAGVTASNLTLSAPGSLLPDPSDNLKTTGDTLIQFDFALSEEYTSVTVSFYMIAPNDDLRTFQLCRGHFGTSCQPTAMRADGQVYAFALPFVSAIGAWSIDIALNLFLQPPTGPVSIVNDMVGPGQAFGLVVTGEPVVSDVPLPPAAAGLAIAFLSLWGARRRH